MKSPQITTSTFPKYKRRFGTNDRESQLKRTFFTDRDLGKSIPRILRAAGISVEEYSDHFKNPTEADHVWLSQVSKRGWITLTHDDEMRRDRLAKSAVMENEGRVLVLRGSMTHRDLATMFLEGITRIDRFLKKHDAPFFAVVRRKTTQKSSTVEVEIKLTRQAWIESEKRH